MRNYSILIISKRSEDFRSFKDALPQDKFSLIHKNDTQLAMALLSQTRFDIIVEDIAIDENGGMELIKTVDQLGNDSRIIFLCDKTSVNRASDAVGFGAFDYLLKPITEGQVQAVVDRAAKSLDNQGQDNAAGNSLTSNLLLLYDVSSILYQVNEFSMAMDMILDTCTEYFKIPLVGITIFNEADDHYKIVSNRNLDEQFVSQFKFSLDEAINNKRIAPDDFTAIKIQDGQIRIGRETFAVPEAYKSVILYPIKFHEKISGFFVVVDTSGKTEYSYKEKRLLPILCNQIGPVLHSAKPVKKSVNSFENIIAKIIKDRVNEARLSLNPISFVVFRIGFLDHFEDTLKLQDAVKLYQKFFHKSLAEKGDLIWLTVDTACFVFPQADLFTAESVCSELKENIEKIRIWDNGQASFSLNYSCISYPQSGENGADIINNLWLKMLEEFNS